MEPESLLPVILIREAQQLVLLGDHCQLGPAVTNPTAVSLGLARSLLERYADSALTLKEQYRMVGPQCACMCFPLSLCMRVCVCMTLKEQ